MLLHQPVVRGYGNILVTVRSNSPLSVDGYEVLLRIFLKGLKFFKRMRKDSNDRVFLLENVLAVILTGPLKRPFYSSEEKRFYPYFFFLS